MSQDKLLCTRRADILKTIPKVNEACLQEKTVLEKFFEYL
jgi:hypothetical protein